VRLWAILVVIFLQLPELRLVLIFIIIDDHRKRLPLPIVPSALRYLGLVHYGLIDRSYMSAMSDLILKGRILTDHVISYVLVLLCVTMQNVNGKCFLLIHPQIKLVIYLLFIEQF
jgi:hypothetical protein